MRPAITFLALFLAAGLALFLLQAPHQACPSGGCLAISEFSASTDKPLYHSRELMWVNLTLASDTGGEAEITVHGIASGGLEHMRMAVNRSVGAGLTRFALQYRLPACNGCAGIIPGTYAITAEAGISGMRVARNTTVELRQ
jgi:hypothetical protein